MSKRLSAIIQLILVTFLIIIYAIGLANPVSLFLSETNDNSRTLIQGVTTESTTEPDEYIVSEVIDGDTIRVSTGDTIRYIGIDTPETKHPQVGIECFGPEAGRFNEQLVLGKAVRLERDVSDTDRYGRLLRYVWLDGKMVNQLLVSEGYAEARAYPPDTKYQERFEQAETEAKENGLGIWGYCPDAL